MAKGLFIIGTNTDIGKTYISSLIVKTLKDEGLNISYYKPILSGAIRDGNSLVPGDVKEVFDRAEIKKQYASAVSYMFEDAVSPHLAFEKVGEKIDINKIKDEFLQHAGSCDYLLVEGCGGLICPIYIDDKQIILLEDIIKLLNLETVLITDAGLGTINHTLLTVSYAEEKNIVINGIVMNNYDCSNEIHVNNKKTIEMLTGIKVIDCIRKSESKNKSAAISADIIKCFHEIGD